MYWLTFLKSMPPLNTLWYVAYSSNEVVKNFNLIWFILASFPGHHPPFGHLVIYSALPHWDACLMMECYEWSRGAGTRLCYDVLYINIFIAN